MEMLEMAAVEWPEGRSCAKRVDWDSSVCGNAGAKFAAWRYVGRMLGTFQQRRRVLV